MALTKAVAAVVVAATVGRLRHLSPHRLEAMTSRRRRPRSRGTG